MSGFLRVAVTLAAAFIVSSSALAAIEVKGDSATFAWTPSSGPVDYYSVQLARDGQDITQKVVAYVSEPRATIHGRFGETIRVQVLAWGWNGSSFVSSLPSRLSEEVRFVNPAGAAPTPPPPPAGAMPYDFDGDGRTDILWRNKQTGDVAVWLMNGTSAPRTSVLGTLSAKWNVVGSGDFDGDGQADLLLESSQSAAYAILFMNGGSVRKAVVSEGPGLKWNAGAIGDFDGDGYADLLWQKGEKSRVWFMRGSTVDEAVPGAPAAGIAACAPDLDGDGKSDVIWSGPDETVAWLMEGSSPWRSGPAGPGMQESLAVGCGDADGDGFGDVLWYDPKSRLGTLWVMDGDIGVDLSLELPQLKASWAMVASGDFDGDGLANDILLRDAATGMIGVWELRWNYERTRFSVYSTRGSGTGDKNWEVGAP